MQFFVDNYVSTARELEAQQLRDQVQLLAHEVARLAQAIGVQTTDSAH